MRRGRGWWITSLSVIGHCIKEKCTPTGGVSARRKLRQLPQYFDSISLYVIVFSICCNNYSSRYNNISMRVQKIVLYVQIFITFLLQQRILYVYLRRFGLVFNMTLSGQIKSFVLGAYGLDMRYNARLDGYLLIYNQPLASVALFEHLHSRCWQEMY